MKNIGISQKNLVGQAFVQGSPTFLKLRATS